MRQTVRITTIILLYCSGILTAETGELFTLAQDNNPEYQRLHMELELAGLRAERQQIQARDPLDRLQAVDAVLSSRIAYRAGLEVFFLSTLQAAYDVARSETNLEIADLQESLTTEQLRQVELRFERGLVADTEVISARIARRAALRDYENARWIRDDARIRFHEVTGHDWDEVYLPRSDANTYDRADARRDWLDAHLELQRSMVAAEIAQRRRERLPQNAPEFDRRIAAAEVAQAESAATQTQTEASRAFEHIARRLIHLRETILIRENELTLRNELADEFRRSFERGMATTAERDQAAIQRLQARIHLLDAEHDYYSAVVRWKLGLGEIPGGGSLP